jgi:hypothetical protein
MMLTNDLTFSARLNLMVTVFMHFASFSTQQVYTPSASIARLSANFRRGCILCPAAGRFLFLPEAGSPDGAGG